MTSVWNGADLIAAQPTTIATLELADGWISGSTGCNLFRAAYTVDSGSIAIGDLALTGLACDHARVDQEEVFIQALRASARFEVSPEDLELLDLVGDTQMVFRSADELPLQGVTWSAVWFGEGTSPLDGTQISLVFRSDGTLAGIAGCNEYLAQYRVDGNQLEMGTISGTEQACTEPPGVMTQETDYLAVVGDSQTFVTTLTGLELLDSDDQPIAEYRFAGRVRDGESGAG
jgi:heat shock protein HslJ